MRTFCILITVALGIGMQSWSLTSCFVRIIKSLWTFIIKYNLIVSLIVFVIVGIVWPSPGTYLEKTDVFPKAMVAIIFFINGTRSILFVYHMRTGIDKHMKIAVYIYTNI